MSLEEIALLLMDDLPSEQIRSMLVQKQQAMEQQMLQWKEQMTKVEARIWQIEQEGKASVYDVIVKSVPAQTILSMRDCVPFIADMASYRCPMYDSLYEYAESRGIHVKVPELALYQMQEYVEYNIEIELGTVVQAGNVLEESHSGLKQICLTRLPGIAAAASTIHNGNIYEAGKAITALYGWIYQHGYTPCGPIRELHLLGRENDHDHCSPFLMELQIPIHK